MVYGCACCQIVRTPTVGVGHGPVTVGVTDARITCMNTASSAVRSVRTVVVVGVEVSNLVHIMIKYQF